MSTYREVVTLANIFSLILYDCDAALSPEIVTFFEFGLKELKSFRDFVERLNSRSRKRMDASLELVTEELHQFRVCAASNEMCDVHQLMEKTHSLIESLKKMKEECSLLPDENEDEEEAVSPSPSSSSNMIGLCDEQSEVKGAIMDGYEEYPICFILHGMAGIGKTALARELFVDLDISQWFKCRAWVRVGLGRKPEEYLEAILAQLDPDADTMVMGGDEKELAQRVAEILMGKRCLVVLDDVWDTYVLEQYWFRFPGAFRNKNGSRVVITTRTNDIDFTKMTWTWCIYEKQLLNRKQSWDLLREKAFAGGSCPPQLVEAGKKIAEKCDGLPLTIITVAELLLKAEESVWIDAAAQRKHQLFIVAYDQISKVLYPSYKELIDELKLCFLYMAAFPLKYEMRRTRLINLWTAEDIFDPSVKRSELYYHDLESLKCLDFCSLLMVYEKSSTYFSKPPIQAISTCGLHSSWWYFCRKEARKTNFYHVVDCPEDGLEERIKGQSRLSINYNVLFALKDVYNSIEENCASTAESLLCFGPYHQYEVPICFGLKLLQRLDALSIRFYDFPLEVVELVKLRYLALTCNGKLPPSISKLRRLQYLIVHPHLRIVSSGAPSYMPTEIWDLEELKHLQVMGSDLPDSGDKPLGMLSTLLDVSTRSCVVLNRLPNLKKLKIRIELTPDAADPFCFSDHISNLINLESFKCIVVNPECKFRVAPPVALLPVLPSSLKKLSLSGMGYPWEGMKGIALLPCLRQLKLRCNAFQGRIWEVEELGFPSLEFLLIEDIDLVTLMGAELSFKYLKHLIIKHCYKLEGIQLTIYDFPTIEVVDSNPLVEKNIKESIVERAASIGSLISMSYSWKSTRPAPLRRVAYRGC